MPSQNFINDYRRMIAADGDITKEYLIDKMLKLDEALSEDYKTDENLNKLADEILEKKYIRKENATGFKKRDLYEKRMKLYKKGLCDEDIANEVNNHVSTIRYWRIKNGLEPNPTAKDLENAEMDKKRMKFYLQGYSDYRIAKLTNTSHGYVYNWRTRKGLENNTEKSNKEAKNA